MEETEFKGQWWLPEKNNPVGGVATYTPEDAVSVITFQPRRLFYRTHRHDIPRERSIEHGITLILETKLPCPILAPKACRTFTM